MTSITHDYSQYSDPETKARVALNHFAQHLGEVRWFSLVRHAEAGNIPSKNHFRDLCGVLLEVEGYPVEAFIEKYLPDLPEQGDPLIVQVTPHEKEPQHDPT